MKNSFVRSKSARWHSFTLVELLVVMAIIAILAGVLFSAGGAAIRAAQRARAFNLASQLQSACINYYTEYSVYPVPFGTTTDYKILDTDGTSWGALVPSLCGNINPYDGTAYTFAGKTITNARGIPFLSIKQSDVDNKNAPKNPLPPDTTHIYFNIAMDTDYDGVLGVGASAVTTMPNFGAATFNAAAQAGGGSCTSGVAVWANCNTTVSSTPNAGFYVKTY